MPIVILLIFAVGVVFGVAVAITRRAGDTSFQWGGTPRPLELERRLARMEQASEETARAMERLEEGQRFLLSALTERGEGLHPSERALAPGEHKAAPRSEPPASNPETPASPPGDRRE